MGKIPDGGKQRENRVRKKEVGCRRDSVEIKKGGK